MNNEDLLDFQRREEDENLNNRRKRNMINEITVIQNLMKKLVDTIQPSWSGISHNIPIKIDGEGDINYEVVSYYMASKINVPYVEKDSA